MPFWLAIMLVSTWSRRLLQRLSELQWILELQHCPLIILPVLSGGDYELCHLTQIFSVLRQIWYRLCFLGRLGITWHWIFHAQWYNHGVILLPVHALVIFFQWKWLKARHFSVAWWQKLNSTFKAHMQCYRIGWRSMMESQNSTILTTLLHLYSILWQQTPQYRSIFTIEVSPKTAIIYAMADIWNTAHRCLFL